MNFEENFQSHISTLNNDFKVGKNHLIDDLPARFESTDFLFFFMMQDCFWKDVANEENRSIVATAMTELYISVLTHIYSSDFTLSEDSHKLEHSILYGDLLSGAFSEKLVKIRAIDLQKRWLNLLKNIHKQLIYFSLENKSIRNKKECLIKAIMEDIVSKDDPAMVQLALNFLIDHIIPADIEDVSSERIAFTKKMMQRSIASSADLEALIGE